MASWSRPDIVVGIDIGQTCSGVAFSIGPDWSDPRTIQRWPGIHGTEVRDKVATRVSYSRADNKLRAWGESCDFGDETADVREQFKLTLDSRWNDFRGYTAAEAKQWYCDYLQCLHKEIERHFDTHIPKWREQRVEYNFSTPTTWRDPAMIAGIEKAIKSSGFTSTSLQKVRMSLTEAEAAAVEASTTSYKHGDVFLICDAGGGTTDVNILKVQSTTGKIELEPLDHVEGSPIGSTLIDNLMAQHVMERLQLIEDRIEEPIEQLAEDMLTGRFQTIKHSFPDPIVPQFRLEVRVPGRQTFAEAGIEDSAMLIDREVLKIIFDEQINRIFQLIDARIRSLQVSHPHEKISYIILSGGFGSSPYLLEEVKRRYEANFGFSSPNTTNVHIMRIAEPQLSVTKGLVRERTQQLGTAATRGQEAFRYRRCRNSYGVVVSQEYMEDIHRGLPFTINPVTGRRSVDNLVDWFIRQGEIIDIEKGVHRDYGAELQEHDRNQQRHVRIVMARTDISPPRIYTQQSCPQLVTVKYNLTDNDMRVVKKKFGLGKKYWKANFKFVVKVGAADLRFQIQGANGVLSTDHESLEVEFVEDNEPLDPPQSQTPGTSSQSQPRRLQKELPSLSFSHRFQGRLTGKKPR